MAISASAYHSSPRDKLHFVVIL